MKKLAAFIFALLISLSFHADARLVSGTAAHQHDSVTGGGAILSGTTINNTSIGGNSKIAPSIYAYDSAALADEKYYKFGNANGDFVLSTQDDTPATAAVVFSIKRTGTAPKSFDLGKVSLTSSKSCASGFTRVSPNLCRRTTAYANNSLAITNCTGISVPTGAIYVGLHTSLLVRSTNAVGLNYTQIRSYTDATCTTLYETAYISVYEYVATTAGTIIGQVAGHNIYAPVINGFIYLREDATLNGDGTYEITEYFD